MSDLWRIKSIRNSKGNTRAAIRKDGKTVIEKDFR